jgi:hypothetical protein
MWSAARSRRHLRTVAAWAASGVWLGCGGGSGSTDIVLPALSVSTATTGVELDPDGYSLTVDATPAQVIGLDATVVVEQLNEGVHTATLSRLAANCTAAGNPRSFTVQSGITATVDFAISCAPSGGTIQVTTTTTGSGSDPDGFTLLLDGTDKGPVGVSASASLPGIPSGDHMLGLAGLAANCQVAGDNPRSVTVAAGQTMAVPFSVTCAAPEPTAGSVEVTTVTGGSDLDPNGYSVSLDGGTTQPIGINDTVTVANLPAGPHTVELLGAAENCTIAGTNPSPITVPAGGTVGVTFTVSCVVLPPGTGSVKVTTATTGTSDGYVVSVDGGNSQAIISNGTVTIGGLTAGPHSVLLGGLESNCSVPAPATNPVPVTVAAGQTSNVSFAVTCVTAGPSVNLSIEGLYLTQSTQTLSGSVTLIQDRPAYLRVFAKADRATTAKPPVRVRFFRNGSVVSTLTLTHSGSTPTTISEATLNSSWNGRVDGSLIQPGVSILADVDPGNTVLESNETDNSFPASSTPQALNVDAASVAKIRFVPIQQGSAAQGNVTPANKDALLETARKIYPLHGIDSDVGAVYTTSIELDPSGGPTTWGQLLTDLDGVRVVDGSDRTYYGVVKLAYQGGIVGLGFVGGPTAIGTDDPADATRVVAHELGHTWGQLHTPCGGPLPSTIDPNYPYGTGIGVFGFDVAAGTLKPRSTPDIMGYCANPWISDYIYTRVLNFRKSQAAAAQGASAAKEPTVLVWGRIVNGQPVLEPAFQIVTRPNLPTKPGPYSVEAVATDGASLFRLSFDATEVADDPSGSRHFAFAVPLDQARAARLGSLRLTGPAGAVSAASLQVAARPQTAGPDSIVARREAGRVALEWNVRAHPMIMVRDPDTGEVLSFARGGKVRVVTSKARLDLVASDGVQSRTIQVNPQ